MIHGDPILWRKIDIPVEFCITEAPGYRPVRFAGDIRLGDLNGDGQTEFVVYRSIGNAHDEGGMKPCFLGAFDIRGNALWHVGDGGTQPSRPGPVLVHDINGDGIAEIICFLVDTGNDIPASSLGDVAVQIRDGRNGHVLREARPDPVCSAQGSGANWVHQRLLAADLRGLGNPRDIVMKLGDRIVALDENLAVLWTYTSPWTTYGHCPAYIPSVGDIDGDGRDEVNGGYFLLDQDGTILWEKAWAPHMDSVSIESWDKGCIRAICSGGGHVIDSQGNTILSLGTDLVPHGQEVRVGRFTAGPEPTMVLRWNGHSTEMILVDTRGRILNRFAVNQSPNNTGMETVRWDGPNNPERLYNGGMLWEPLTGSGVPLPDLPEPKPIGRMSWYHCIPADICGDRREELVLYNPWEPRIYIYTPFPFDENLYTGYEATARQYNARLMD